MARRERYTERPRRGDERRALLLTALRELLDTRALATIGVTDITRAAGVTRSAFYFYFPTKAAAVAALLSELRDQIRAAGETWYEASDSTPLRRVRTSVDTSVSLWRGQSGLLVAMLDATGQDPEVRAAWQSWTEEFIEQIAARISQDQAAGLIGTTGDTHALATVLMGATLYAMERDVRSIAEGGSPSEALPSALVELWHRTLYSAG